MPHAKVLIASTERRLSRLSLPAIEQVNKAVVQMDEMTQQNAALVEEAAAASESMETQSQGLLQQISFFTVDE